MALGIAGITADIEGALRHPSGKRLEEATRMKRTRQRQEETADAPTENRDTSAGMAAPGKLGATATARWHSSRVTAHFYIGTARPCSNWAATPAMERYV